MVCVVSGIVMCILCVVVVMCGLEHTISCTNMGKSVIRFDGLRTITLLCIIF